jgi:hypothetical protein
MYKNVLYDKEKSEVVYEKYYEIIKNIFDENK